MKSQFKRTRLWIDPPLQTQLLLRLALHLVACSFVLFHIAFLYKVLANLPEVLDGGVLTFYTEFCTSLVPLLVALIVVLPVFLYDMVKFSHRFAGPLYRFRKTLEAMAAGKQVEPIKIRKQDLLRDWVPAFNTLIWKWNAQQDAAAGHLDDDVPVAELVEEEPEPAAASGALS